MTDSDAILEELRSQGKRLSNIEQTIQSIAVQDNKILTLQKQSHDLYMKYEDSFGPNGIIANMSKFQASCPRNQLHRIWWAVGIIATGELGMFGVMFTMISKMGA